MNISLLFLHLILVLLSCSTSISSTPNDGFNGGLWGPNIVYYDYHSVFITFKTKHKCFEYFVYLCLFKVGIYILLVKLGLIFINKAIKQSQIYFCSICSLVK